MVRQQVQAVSGEEASTGSGEAASTGSGEAASTGSGECRTSLKYKHHPYSPWLLADMLFQIYILYLRKIYALVRLNCYILIVNIVFQLAVANVNFPMF